MKISELYRTLQPLESISHSKPFENQKSEFSNILKKEVALSLHAETRIQSRNILWDEATKKRVEEGMDVAASKGSKEALILLEDVAVVANIKTRTVITAMNRSEMKDRIITNIDSAVIA